MIPSAPWSSYSVQGRHHDGQNSHAHGHLRHRNWHHHWRLRCLHWSGMAEGCRREYPERGEPSTTEHNHVRGRKCAPNGFVVQSNTGNVHKPEFFNEKQLSHNSSKPRIKQETKKRSGSAMRTSCASHLHWHHSHMLMQLHVWGQRQWLWGHLHWLMRSDRQLLRRRQWWVQRPG